MDQEQQINTLLSNLESQATHLIQATLSSPLNKECAVEKIVIRALEEYVQIARFQDNKVFHENVDLKELIQQLRALLPQYRQIVIFTETADYHILGNKKGKITVLTQPSSKKLGMVAHNRQKKHLLPEGTTQPFLVELGVMSSDGKVLAKKQDKFKQVNRFLEIVSEVVEFLPEEGPIHVVDFGCGKATLTFGLYAYLHSIFGDRIFIHGVDLKEDVLSHCQSIANKLGYKNLKFSKNTIEGFHLPEKVSMVVALHACDTATDDALIRAVDWKSEVILAVPCCQHELASQVKHEALKPLLKHGILRERFAALATDAMRAQLLEERGYQAQILEFIDLEHTAKNLLIRAIKNPKHRILENEYNAFKQLLNIESKLEKKLRN